MKPHRILVAPGAAALLFAGCTTFDPSPVATHGGRFVLVFWAIVLFSLAIGLAIIGVPKKGGFIAGLDVIGDAIMRIAGSEVGLDQFPLFQASGLLSFFGEVVAALPFLLDRMRIPADMFELFLAADMAHLLANEQGVGLEFVRVNRRDLGRHLDAGRIDLVMSGLLVTPERALELRFTEPHLVATPGLVVPGHARSLYDANEELRAAESLTVAAVNLPYYSKFLKRHLPTAEVIGLDLVRDFFRTGTGDLRRDLAGAAAGGRNPRRTAGLLDPGRGRQAARPQVVDPARRDRLGRLSRRLNRASVTG